MNNTALKIIAGLLLLGSLAVGYIGIQMSSAPPAPAKTVVVQAAAPAVPTMPVVVAARALKKGQVLSPDDVVIKPLPTPPLSAFRVTSDLMGRTLTESLAPGAVLLPTLLASDTMASLLRPGERAMAVQVDEVVGLGGYAQPGDRVDVLLFMPGNRETNDQSSAQVILHNARLLTVGDASQMASEVARREAGGASSSTEVSSSKTTERNQQPRSAVLAIPESDVSRLMLAASSGQLRLALRPQASSGTDAVLHVADKASDVVAAQRRTITLSDIAPGARKAPASKASQGEGIIIQEGSKERQLVKNDIPLQQP